MDRLALAVFEAVGLDESDLGVEADRGLQLVLDLRAEFFEFGHVVGEETVFDFDGDFKGIGVADTVDGHEVVRCDAVDVEQSRFDLGREHVDALDDEHVIGTSLEALDAGHGAAAFAFLILETGDVSRPVTDEGLALFGETGDDEFAFGALRKLLAGLRVDDFRQEVVFPDVEASVEIAVRGDAGTGDLRQAVNVVGFDVETSLDLLAHLVGPGFGAVDGAFQRDLIDAAGRLEFFRDVQQIGRRTADDGRFAVDQHVDEFLGVAGTHRDDQSAEFLGTVVSAEAAGEQAVAVRDQNDVVCGDAGHGHGTGHALGPDIDILAGIERNLRFAGRAGRRLQTDALGQRYGLHAERICGAKVFIGGERKLGQVLDPVDVGRLQAHFLHFVAIVLVAVVDMFDDLAQTGALQFMQCIAIHALFGRVPDHDFISSWGLLYSL